MNFLLVELLGATQLRNQMTRTLAGLECPDCFYEFELLNLKIVKRPYHLGMLIWNGALAI